jgi:hypothetical protein
LPALASVPDIYVHVHWPWIALPACVMASSLFFLALAMLQSHRYRIQVWKSSTLALLFHGLDRPVEDAAHINDMSGMEKCAKEIRVRLGPTENNGWMLLRLAEGRKGGYHGINESVAEVSSGSIDQAAEKTTTTKAKSSPRKARVLFKLGRKRG